MSIRFCVALFCVVAARGLAQPQTAPAQTNTVIWLSIDGFRHDYLERFRPPTLSRLAAEGAYTNAEKPIFPSLTFPNHTAQVTGVTVDRHGVVMNAWFDRKLQATFSFPDHPEFIRVEPIWLTAQRQGVPTAVVDWPMSTAQSGPLTSDYFDPGYDSKETDTNRLNRVLAVLNTHHLPASTTEPSATQPTSHDRGEPRLILSYLSEIDHVGHRDGPESEPIRDAVLETDGVIERFLQGVTAWFERTHGRGEELYVIFSTDHGMMTTRTQVNLDRLIGVDLMHGVKIVTSGPMACVYLTDVWSPTPPLHSGPSAAISDQERAHADMRFRETREQHVSAMRAQLASVSYLKCWPSNALPAAYRFADADRAGDLVVLLDGGYTFTSNRDATTRPVGERGPHGMHGYDPSVEPDLLGSAIIWRHRRPLGGKDLGPVDNTQWHATVAKLLGIEPSKDADPRVLTLPE